MTYRLFTHDDLTQIRELSTDYWRETHKHITGSLTESEPGEVCYVAEDSGMVVGYAYGVELPFGTILLYWVYVADKWRGRGVGSELVKKIEERAGESVLVFYNRALHGWYERMGYCAGNNLEVAIKQK